MSEFEAEAVRYFTEDVGPGMLQRVDGVNCFSKLPEFWFWRSRLNKLVKRGVLISRPMGSIWPSCNGMTAYGISASASDE